MHTGNWKVLTSKSLGNIGKLYRYSVKSNREGKCYKGEAASFMCEHYSRLDFSWETEAIQNKKKRQTACLAAGIVKISEVFCKFNLCSKITPTKLNDITFFKIRPFMTVSRTFVRQLTWLCLRCVKLHKVVNIQEVDS